MGRLLIISLAVSGLWTGMASAQRPRRAYEVHQEETLDAGSGPSVVSRIIRAQRSTGAYTTVTIYPGPAGELRMQTTHLEDGRLLAPARSDLGVQSTRRVPLAEALAEQFDPKTNCTVSFSGDANGHRVIGEETVNGFRAIRMHHRSADRIVTNWFVPELDCLMIQRKAEFLDASGRIEQTGLLRTIRIKTADVDESLFAFPAGYVEVSPSEEARRAEELRTGQRISMDVFLAQLPDSKRLWLEKMDAKYKARQ